MKKRLLFSTVLFVAAAFAAACDDDTTSDYPTAAALVTLRTLDTENAGQAPYYIQFDNGKTAYLAATYVTGYRPDDGQRAIISYRPLDKAPEGYDNGNGILGIHFDYGICIYDIDEVLTKGTILLDAENAAEVGDDRIDILNAWVSGGHCNILFSFATDGTKKHLLNLAENTLAAADDSDGEGYTELTFRQNAFGDTSGLLYRGYVSFRLGDYDPAVSGAKGIRIRYTALDGKEQTLKLHIVE